MILQVDDKIKLNPEWIEEYEKHPGYNQRFRDEYIDKEYVITKIEPILDFFVIRCEDAWEQRDWFYINKDGSEKNFPEIKPSMLVIVGTEQKGAQEAPQNNDGRSTCFWCKARTKKSLGFNSYYDICTECGK